MIDTPRLPIWKSATCLRSSSASSSSIRRASSHPRATGKNHLHALGLSAVKVTPDPVLIASEAALWAAIHHQGLLPDTVIVS